MKKLLPLLFIGLSAKAAVITATSCNYPDVVTAVASANFGDTVILPNGLGSWWGTINISGITLAGQGTNNTIIQDNTPVSGGGYYNGTPILAIHGTNAALTRVTGIQFKSGVTNNLTTAPGNYGGEVQVSGTCPKWQIDKCYFNLLSGKNIQVLDDSFGVVTTCYFITQSKIALEVFGNGYGDTDWATNTTYGSTNSVHFENNFCHDNYSFGWVDCSQGGRLTYRYNYVEGCYLNTHGAETSQRYRSSRWIECYMNTFTNPVVGNFNNLATAVDLRGGGALVWSNTVWGYKYMTDIEYYRSDDNNPGFTPWFGMTGISGWDNNGSAILVGNSTTAGNTLTPVTFAATPNQYVGYTVYNNNTTLCGIVSANTATTMSFTTGRDAAYQIKFSVGDAFHMYKPYPAVDMPGLGQCDLLTGDSPTPRYLNFQANIVCNWSNRVSTYANFIIVPASSAAVTPYPNILNGRDYTNVAKAGYTPLPYPYPNLTTVNPIVPPVIAAPSKVGFIGNIGNISHMH